VKLFCTNDPSKRLKVLITRCAGRGVSLRESEKLSMSFLNWEGEMKTNHRTRLGILWLAGSLLLALSTTAQQNQTAVSTSGTTAYSLSRETVLTGTVVSYKEGNSRTGSVLTLNTSSGVTDVNVGNAKLLSLNGMTFSAGESVKVTGENVTTLASAPVFAVRIVQKGSQSLTVRSERGFMARPTAANTPANALQKRGAL
jgi:hypothetical protein